jgi:hypothetical protein
MPFRQPGCEVAADFGESRQVGVVWIEMGYGNCFPYVGTLRASAAQNALTFATKAGSIFGLWGPAATELPQAATVIEAAQSRATARAG